jgi:uncharacterized protein YukE
MADVSLDPVPPPIVDPVLANLTFDQLAQLVNEISPDVFYQEAVAFDNAAARLQEVLDAFRHETRTMQDAWSGEIAETFDGMAEVFSGYINGMLQSMQDPGYGTRMRQAGDALAAAQQRLKDLQAQKAQQAASPVAPGAPPAAAVDQGNQQLALQIVYDLSIGYRDIGFAIPPLLDAARVPNATDLPDPVVHTGPPGGTVNVVEYVVPTPSGTGGPTGFPAVVPITTFRTLSEMPGYQGEPIVGGGRPGGDRPVEFSPAFSSPTEFPSSVLGLGRSHPHSVTPKAIVDELPSGTLGRPQEIVGDPVAGVRFTAMPATSSPLPERPKTVKAQQDKKTKAKHALKSETRELPAHEVSTEVRPATVSLPSDSGPAVVSHSAITDLGAPPANVAPANTVAHAEVAGLAAVSSATAGGPSAASLPVPAAGAHQAALLEGTITGATSQGLPAEHLSGLGAAAPGGAPQAASPVHPLSAELASSQTGAFPMTHGTPGAAPGTANANTSAQGGGQSPSMMGGMGGMGGMPQPQNARVSEIVPGPDRGVWDFANGAPAALGKAEPAPDGPMGQESAEAMVARIMEGGK